MPKKINQKKCKAQKRKKPLHENKENQKNLNAFL